MYLVQFTGYSALNKAKAGAQGWNMEAGGEAETMAELLLVGLLALACLVTFLR